MRIVAGSRKGATIFAPNGLDTRPTGDRVREAAFDLIGSVDGANVLDLFAGSGALGLEALSRGAARATFVEQDEAAARMIVRNLEKLRLQGAVVLRDDARRKLAADAAAGNRYDLVLVDPPYGRYSDLEMTLDDLLPPVLSDQGLLVVETDGRTQPALSLEQVTSRRYGSTRVTVYAR